MAARAANGVRGAQDRGWEVALIPTDASLAWIDTGSIDVPVVTGQREPDQAKRLPPADAIAVAPLTFNTLNAWATAVASTYPLATLCAALGTRTPTVAVPFAKHDLAGHPAWLASLAVLQYAGVTIVDPTTGAKGRAGPIASGTGDDVAAAFDWACALGFLER